MDMSSAFLRLDGSLALAQRIPAAGGEGGGDLIGSWVKDEHAQTQGAVPDPSHVQAMKMLKEAVDSEIQKASSQWQEDRSNLKVELQKIHTFLLLRTRFKALEKLEENPEFEYVCNPDRQLSPDLFFSLVDKPNFHQFTYDSIFYAPQDLCLDMLNTLVNYLSRSTEVEVYSWRHVHQVLIGRLIICEQQGDENGAELLMDCYKRLLFICAKCKIGFVNLVLLKTLQFCLESLPVVEETKITDSSCIPCQTILQMITVVTSQATNYTQFYARHMEKVGSYMTSCLCLLLETLMAKMEITVDMWMSFAEVNVPESDHSLQTAIGHAAYHCHKLIPDVICMDLKLDAVVPMLSGLAIQPEEEIYDPTNIMSLVLIIATQQGKLKCDCFNYLLCHPDLFVSDDGLACLENNLDFFTMMDVKALTGRTSRYLESGDSDEEQIERVKCLLVDAMTGRSLEDQAKFLQQHLDTYGSGSILQMSDFHAKFLEFMNKITEEEQTEKTSTQVVKLCLQNPVSTLERLVQESVANLKLTPTMADLLHVIKCAGQFPSQDEPGFLLGCILKKHLLKLSSDAEERSFQALIRLLVKIGVVTRSQCTSILLPVIATSIKGKSFELLRPSLEVFQAVLKVRSSDAIVTEDNAVVLAVFFAQQLQVLDLRSKEMTGSIPHLRELVTSILSLLVPITKGKCSRLEGKFANWFLEKIHKLKPSDQLYLQDITALCGSLFLCHPTNLPETMLHYMRVASFRFTVRATKITYAVPLNKVSQRDIILSMFQVLPDSTLHEWIVLVELVRDLIELQSVNVKVDSGQALLKHFQEAVGLILHAESTSTHQDDPRVEHVIRCFCHTVKDEIFPLLKAQNSDPLPTLFQSIVPIARRVRGNALQQLSLLLMNLFSDIIKERDTISEGTLTAIASCLYLLPDGDVKHHIAQRLLQLDRGEETKYNSSASDM